MLTKSQPNLNDLLDYIPEQKTDLNNFEVWKKKLSFEDVAFWDKILENIVFTGDYIRYLGKVKRVVYGPYETILNDPSWKVNQRKQFTTYVMNKFGSIDKFNEYIKRQKEAVIHYNEGIVYYTNEKFNLIVCLNNQINPMVYILLNKNVDCTVKQLCSFNDSNAKRVIANYIRINFNGALKGVKNESKIYDAFLEEVSRGYHRIDKIPVTFSNNPETYCLSYIDLKKYNKIGPTPAWDVFVSQFETDNMKKEFMSWVWGIFVDTDFNRTVLWLEGPSQTGKTTVANVISDHLAEYNQDMVGSLAKHEDKFNLSSVVNARLALYSDAKDDRFFQRKDVLNLTGRDIVFYEEKFKNAESKKLYVKILVTTNHQPNVDKDFERSRLLRIKIDSKKVPKKNMSGITYSNKLADELPFFLKKCKEYYNQQSY